MTRTHQFAPMSRNLNARNPEDAHILVNEITSALDKARLRKRAEQACYDCSKHHRKCETEPGQSRCKRCAKNNIECSFSAARVSSGDRDSDESPTARSFSGTNTSRYPQIQFAGNSHSGPSHPHQLSPSSPYTPVSPVDSRSAQGGHGRGMPVNDSQYATPHYVQQQQQQYSYNAPEWNGASAASMHPGSVPNWSLQQSSVQLPAGHEQYSAGPPQSYSTTSPYQQVYTSNDNSYYQQPAVRYPTQNQDYGAYTAPNGQYYQH